MTIRDVYQLIRKSYDSGTLNRMELEQPNKNGYIVPLLERLTIEEEKVYLEDIRLLLETVPGMESVIWEQILEQIEPDCLSDPLLKYFFEHKIALTTLGHMELPNQWLKRFGQYVEEALFTLGKRLYRNEEYSVADFANLLTEYQSDSLLNILISQTPSHQSKRSVLVRACSEYGSADTQRSCSSMLQRERLLLSVDPVALNNAYYGDRDPEVLLALSQNLFTPKDVLEALTQIKSVSKAQIIRQSAQTTLKLQCVFPSHDDP